MAAKVEEAYSERTEKVNASGEIVEIEIHYLVFDAADEDAALEAARTKAKAKTVTGMSFESVEVEERVNSTTWRVKAEYASTGSSGFFFVKSESSKRTRINAPTAAPVTITGILFFFLYIWSPPYS